MANSLGVGENLWAWLTCAEVLIILLVRLRLQPRTKSNLEIHDGKSAIACAQICAKIPPTITAAIAQPAPTKKPTQNPHADLLEVDGRTAC
jgi:hypothetical protein